jgi:DNA-binding NarL/FixJ family response regulator
MGKLSLSPTSISAREQQVLSLLAHGRTNEEIARELYISVETVKSHARRIYSSLGARNGRHAVYLAMRDGLID